MSEEQELKIYHLICNIAKECKEYFFGRKYLPRDFWSEDKAIKAIINKSKELDKKYKDIKKEMKEK